MKFIKTRPRFCLLVCSVIFGVFCTSAKAGHVKGILLPEMIALDKNKLHLNGTAVRAKWGFNVYVVALYLTEKVRDADTIMLNRNPKRIHITMLNSVSEKRFVSTIMKNIDINFTAEEKVKFASGITDFMACFHGGTSLKKYSTINIDYFPGKGMHVEVDGEGFKMIPGDDFYHAIMRLWIGQPLQKSIREGLVGQTDKK